MSEPTSQQLAAVAARGDALVAAGAGTGKTSTVTERCLELVLRERCSIEEILLVTFTEAAATEMRERIRQRLRLAADQAPPDSDDAGWLAEQLALLERAPLSTLHSFCLELVRRHFPALGLDPQFTVLDEAQTQPLIHAVLEELLLGHYAGETPFAAEVRELIRTYGRGRDEPIRELLVQLHRHTQTLAAPTAWFAEQMAWYGGNTPDEWRQQFPRAVSDWAQLWANVLGAATAESTNLAASQCALTQLLAHRSPTFAQAAESVAAVVAADQAEWKRGTKTKYREPLEGFFADAKFLHELAQDDGAALTEDWQWSRGPMLTLLRLAQEFGIAFARAKRELGGIDFADQEQFALRLLSNPDGTPTPVARACREKFRYVFVDECQDINAAQDAILRAVSRTGAEANRFLVGDVKQSIYRFRLADPRIFQSYETRWKGTVPPGESTNQDRVRATAGRVLALTENFRSAEGLLKFINPLFRALMRPVIGGLTYDPDAELQFGAAEARAPLAASHDTALRVELNIISKADEPAPANAEPAEAEGRATDIPDLQTDEREARLIARQLRQLHASRHQVWDRAAPDGGFRDVEYSDMVVLMRGLAGRAEIFAKAFHQLGVPLLVGRAGFLTALEIRDVLNLLRLLDNPLQDLPLLAVLRSPLVGLSANELAQLRVVERRRLLWLVLNQAVNSSAAIPTELKSKLADFIGQFHRWRELIRHTSLTHCLETALNETHYEALLLAGERGAQRVANVRRLLELARRFDPFRREGLYRFLQFINEQETLEVEHPPADATPENAVRLLTIHASKGLEFPVVAVAGLGTRFNFRALSSDILLEEQSGLCPKIFPPGTRSKYPSLAHWSAAQRERRALLGEELRLLYVALTRARDRLLLVGTASRKAETARWQSPAAITDHARFKAGNYLEWLRLWFVNETAPEDWANEDEGKNALLRWKFWPANDAEFAPDPATPSAEETLPVAPTPEQWSQIRQLLANPYPHAIAVNEPAKTTVTALRRRVSDEADDEARRVFQPLPSFASARAGDGQLNAAAIGIAHHTFLQFVALARTATELDLRNEAARLERDGILSPEQAAALDFAALASFWQSELGDRIRSLPEPAVNREMPFTARFRIAEVEALLPPEQTAATIPDPEDDFIIVQGIADLVALLPDEIWLVDFKTDQVGPEALSAKVQQYEPQLRLYALALARIYQRPVAHCWLHFLTGRQTIGVKA